MFCPKCGYSVVDNAKFCRNCGESLQQPAPVNATVAPVTEETVAPVTEETVALVTEETVAPVTEETVAPVTEETVAPVTEETVAPVTEETVAPVQEDAPITAPAAVPEQTDAPNALQPDVTLGLDRETCTCEHCHPDAQQSAQGEGVSAAVPAAAVNAAPSSFCGVCGTPCSPGQPFCGKCGARIGTAQQAGSAAPAIGGAVPPMGGLTPPPLYNSAIDAYNSKVTTKKKAPVGVIAGVSAAALIVVIVIGIIISNGIKEKAIESYKQTAERFNTTCWSCGSNLEDVGNEIQTYWGKYVNTSGYSVYYNGHYMSSANDAVTYALRDNSGTVALIESDWESIQSMYRQLQDVPDNNGELDEMYDDIEEVYEAMEEMYDCVINTSGNYATYKSYFGTCDSNLADALSDLDDWF